MIRKTKGIITITSRKILYWIKGLIAITFLLAVGISCIFLIYSYINLIRNINSPLAICGYLCICILVGLLGKKIEHAEGRKIGKTFLWFILSLLFTPLPIIILLLALTDPEDIEKMSRRFKWIEWLAINSFKATKCPYCGRLNNYDPIECKYCHRLIKYYDM